MVVVNMAGCCTFVIWTITILAVILLKDLQGVFSGNTKVDCGPLYDPLKDMDFPYGARITWPSIIGSVVYKNHSTSVGSVAEFRCEKGYYVCGPKYAVCGSNRKWVIREKELRCDRINCIEPDFDIEHGKIETSSEDISPRTYILNSIYWVTCDYGYKPNGSAVRVCLVNSTDNESLYKGIWSQRDEDGKMLPGGDTVPECVQDTLIAESNTTHKAFSQTGSLSTRAVERGLLICLSVLCVILIMLGIITTISLFRLKTSELCGWKCVKSKSCRITLNDGEVESVPLSVPLLDNGSKSKLRSMVQEKESKLEQIEKEKNEVVTERNNMEKQKETAENERDDMEKEKMRIEKERDDMEKEKEQTEQQLRGLVKEYSDKRCSKCVGDKRMFYLERDRERHVNTIMSIKDHIKEIESEEIERYIISNNKNGIGKNLLKLLGKFRGLVESCDTSRSDNSLHTDATDVQDEHMKVKKFKEDLGIPCKHCMMMEYECKQKEYQVNRLVAVIVYINEQLISKIESFIDSISQSKASEKGNKLNKVLGRILGLIESSETSRMDNCETSVYRVDQRNSLSGPQNRSRGESHLATGGRANMETGTQLASDISSKFDDINRNQGQTGIPIQLNTGNENQNSVKLVNELSSKADTQIALTFDCESTTKNGEQIHSAVRADNERGSNVSLAVNSRYNEMEDMYQSAVQSKPENKMRDREYLINTKIVDQASTGMDKVEQGTSSMDRKDGHKPFTGKIENHEISTVENEDYKSSAAEVEEQEFSVTNTAERGISGGVDGTNTGVRDNKLSATEVDNQGFPATNNISNTESKYQEFPTSNDTDKGFAVTQKSSNTVKEGQTSSATKILDQVTLTPISNCGHQEQLPIEAKAKPKKGNQKFLTTIKENNGSSANGDESSTEMTDHKYSATEIKEDKTVKCVVATSQSDIVQGCQGISDTFNESDTEKVDHQSSGIVAEQKGSSGEDKGSMTADDLSKPERGDEKFVDTVTEDEELCASANKFTTESKHQEHSEGNVPGNNDKALMVSSVSAGGRSKHIQSKSDSDS